MIFQGIRCSRLKHLGVSNHILTTLVVQGNGCSVDTCTIRSHSENHCLRIHLVVCGQIFEYTLTLLKTIAEVYPKTGPWCRCIPRNPVPKGGVSYTPRVTPGVVYTLGYTEQSAPGVGCWKNSSHLRDLEHSYFSERFSFKCLVFLG